MNNATILVLGIIAIVGVVTIGIAIAENCT